MKNLKKGLLALSLGILVCAGSGAVWGAAYTTNSTYGNARTRGAHASGAIYNEAYAQVSTASSWRYNRNAYAAVSVSGPKSSSHSAYARLIWAP